MANYSEEQLRRKAHLLSGGTPSNYDRSHYTKTDDKMKLGENNNDTSKTNND